MMNFFPDQALSLKCGVWGLLCGSTYEVLTTMSQIALGIPLRAVNPIRIIFHVVLRDMQTFFMCYAISRCS